MDTIWDICEAIGVGGAAGLSPLVAVAVLVIAAALSIGLSSDNSDVDFLAEAAAVVVAAIVIIQSFLLLFLPGGLRMRVAADRPRLLPIHLTLSVLMGAIGGGIVFGAEHESAAVGAIAGALSGGLVGYAAAGLLGGVGTRLDASASRSDDKEAPGDADASKRIVAFGVDLLAMVAVVVPLLVPLTGLILPILALFVILGSRRREAKKHEGLRVLS